MRIRLLPIVIVVVGLVLLLELMVGLAHAQPFAHTSPIASANQGVSTPMDGAVPTASAALTDAERCSVDSLAQRATIMALRAELAKLQARIAELEAPLVDQAVARERAALEQRFRDRLKPPADQVFDWQTLTFTAPKAPAKEPQQ